MSKDPNLDIIREKICRLKTAIMYSCSNDDMLLPNTIVTADRVDDEGQLWFSCPVFSKHLLTGDGSFPARLHFYRKGVPYHVEVSGKTTLMMYKKNSPDVVSNIDMPTVIFRMPISNVEYTEVTEKRSKTKIEQMVENGYSWMLRHLSASQHRHSLPHRS